MIRDHLTFKGIYAKRCDQIRALFDAQPGPVITAHLRRGDFGTGLFFIAPEVWYLEWLSTLREEHPELSVYIASDDIDAVKSAFSDYPLLTEADLPKSELAHDFATDFIALTQGDGIAISNSSFSFAALIYRNSSIVSNFQKWYYSLTFSIRSFYVGIHCTN